MLERIRHFVNEHPGATNFAVAAEFGLTRSMADRYLEWLEDAGAVWLDRPAEVCTGCAPKPSASAGSGCGVGGAAAAFNARAAALRGGRAAAGEPGLQEG